jgi:type I restriction enzyme, S subunit
MEVKPGYKPTEVGVIPDDWDVLTAADLVDPRAPIGYGVVQVGTDTNGGVPVVPIKYVKEIATAPLHRVARSLEAPYARSRVRGGDVLISIKGTIGRVGVVPQGFIGNISRDLARLRPSSEISGDYIAHQLEGELTQSRISQAVVGTTRLEFSIAALRKFQLPIPRRPDEQRAIAETLSDLDGLLRGLDRLIAKKRDLKQAAMQQLLTGQTRLPGFHGEWETKRIGEFTDCTAGGTPSTSVPAYWGGSIRWMSSGELNLKRVEEVDGRITEEGLRNSSTRMIPKKCVLIGLAGQGKTRGTVAMNFVELCTNQSIAAIFPSLAFVPEFLYYNLDTRYDELRDLSSGDGGRGGLNLKLIKSLRVPLPTIPEQAAIAEVLTEMDAELAALEQRREKTRALKQAMMQELLTGKTRLVQTEVAHA